MWALASVQGPNITMYGPQAGQVQKENKGEFAAAINFMLSNGWEPMSAGDQNLVVVWFRKRVS